MFPWPPCAPSVDCADILFVSTCSYIPTFVSFIRWGQEAYYLTEIAQYKNIYLNVEAGMEVYGYAFSDETTCWLVLGASAIIIRALAFIALVKKER